MVELQTPGRTWSRKLFQSLECKIIPSLQTLSNSMLQSSWLSGWRSNSLVLSILGLQYSRELVLYLNMLIINKLIGLKLHFTKLWHNEDKTDLSTKQTFSWWSLQIILSWKKLSLSNAKLIFLSYWKINPLSKVSRKIFEYQNYFTCFLLIITMLWETRRWLELREAISSLRSSSHKFRDNNHNHTTVITAERRTLHNNLYTNNHSDLLWPSTFNI